MKKYIVGIVLFSIPFFSSAEVKFVSEILVGQSKNKIHSNIQGDSGGEDNYYSHLNSNSFAFRLGLKFTENLSFELAKHNHGSAVNQLTDSIPVVVGGSIVDYYTYERNMPIDTTSLRLGMKGEVEIITGLSLNARLGLAHWEYDEYTPQDLIAIGWSTDTNGNDIYYSLGAEYKLTENFYVGVEYSVLPIDKNFEDKDLEASGYFDHTIKDLSFIVGWEF